MTPVEMDALLLREIISHGDETISSISDAVQLLHALADWDADGAKAGRAERFLPRMRAVMLHTSLRHHLDASGDDPAHYFQCVAIKMCMSQYSIEA